MEQCPVQLLFISSTQSVQCTVHRHSPAEKRDRPRRMKFKKTGYGVGMDKNQISIVDLRGYNSLILNSHFANATGRRTVRTNKTEKKITSGNFGDIKIQLPQL